MRFREYVLGGALFLLGVLILFHLQFHSYDAISGTTTTATTTMTTTTNDKLVSLNDLLKTKVGEEKKVSNINNNNNNNKNNNKNVPAKEEQNKQQITDTPKQPRKRQNGKTKWLDFGAEEQLDLSKDLREAKRKDWRNLGLHQCPSSVVQAVEKPALSKEKFDWCQWALRSDGGKVVVGKSYGILNGKQREEYEQLNCNAVQKGINPSCDFQWGDGQVITWKNRSSGELCRANGGIINNNKQKASKVHCFDSQSESRFCYFENVMLDFSKMKNVPRPGTSDTRAWEKGFLGTDCDSSFSDIKYYKQYGPVVDASNAVCDVTIHEPVLLYGHDDSKNLGHTMSDFMNVWLMLWLSGYGPVSKNVTFLNVDAIREGHNYHDELTPFFRHYQLNFKQVIKASSFPPNAKVCLKTAIYQPQPVILFTWDGWWQDMKCSFVGPSSLFQRWNLQVRQSYGLLPVDQTQYTSGVFKILLILRRSSTSNSRYTSRVFGNEGDMISALKSIPNTDVLPVDLATLDFEKQIRLIHSASIIVGMHGAGVASAMHMAVGTPNCCGVLEIFPPGEFQPIRGYGNMARRMGHHYQRMEIISNYVEPKDLIKQTKSIIANIQEKPSCVLPSTLENPFFV